MIEKALVSLLINDSGVSALVGKRVYPMRLKQGTLLPAIVYQRISTPRVLTHDQTYQGLAEPRFQFAVYAETFEEMEACVRAIRVLFQGYKGVVSLGEDSIRIDGILTAGEITGFEPELDLYYTMADYMVSHEES